MESKVMSDKMREAVCMVCGVIWRFMPEMEDLMRAAASPCGHQGLFTVRDVSE